MNNSKELLQKDEFELDINSMIRAVLKDWLMILTAGLLGVIVAFFVSEMAYTPQYTTSMTFIVSSKGATSSLSNTSAANAMAETFSEVLNSRLLKKRVKEELNLNYMPGTITTTVVEDTNLMTLKVSAQTPEHSFKIMKSVLNNYSEITDHVLNNVVLDVLEAPQVPTHPSNPIDARGMMKKYALYAMALMALFLAVVDYLRDNVKNEREVEKKLDTTHLGTIYHEEKYKTLRAKILRRKKGLLITDPMTSFMFVENYKKIRTKLLYKSRSKKAKVFLVTSILENEGKSTFAVNIALALAQKSGKVLLIDGDMRRPAVHKILKKKDVTEHEIGRYIKNEKPLSEVFYKDEENNLYLAIGSKPHANSTEMVSSQKMRDLLETAKKEMDYIVIDSPPTSLMADSEVLAEYADFSMLVVRQGMARSRDINDAIDMLERGGSELLGCIFNDVRTGIFTGKKSWVGYGYSNGYGYGYGYGYGKYHKGKYGRYGRYGKYGKYGNYGRYGKHTDMVDDEEDYIVPYDENTEGVERESHE